MRNFAHLPPAGDRGIMLSPRSVFYPGDRCRPYAVNVFPRSAELMIYTKTWKLIRTTCAVDDLHPTKVCYWAIMTCATTLHHTVKYEKETHSTMPTKTDIVIDFLETQHQDPICDDCISEISRVEPRQQVNQICRRVAKTGNILRSTGTCAICGKTKLCNVLTRQSHPRNSNNLGKSTEAGPPYDSIGHVLDIQEMRDHIVRFCRELSRLHDCPSSYTGASRLVIELREANALPSHQANMMLTIYGLRNVFSYEKIKFGSSECTIAQEAWKIIETWCILKHKRLWERTGR